MDEYLGVVDYIAIFGVLLISAGIGIFFRFSGGKQKTANEFLMASRSMSSFPVIFSLVVTFVSAIMMLGTPAEIYKFGMYRIIAYISSTVANVFSAYLFLPVYFQMGASVSVYEYLYRRFGMVAKNVASILFILQTVFYVAVVLYAPALALNAVITTLPTWASVIGIGVVCTFYCTLGGMKAVLWTDVFQAFVMYITVFAILGAGIVAVGGFWEILDKAHDGGRLAMWNFSTSLSDRYTFWNSVTYGFVFGLANYGCNQSQVQRMLSVKNLKKSQKSVIISVPLAIVFISINFMLGLILYAYFYECDPLSIPDISKRRSGDQLIPYFILKELSKIPGLAGICVAGIFSGSLSSVSSALNSLSAVTMEDFVRPYVISEKLTDKKAAILAKVLAFSYGLAGIALSFLVAEIKGLVKAFTMLYSTVAGPVLGLFILGMMTVRSNQKGAVFGLISGFLASAGLVTNSLSIGSRHVPLPTSIARCPSFGNNSSYKPLTPELNSIYRYNTSELNETSFTSVLDDVDMGNRHVPLPTSIAGCPSFGNNSSCKPLTPELNSIYTYNTSEHYEASFTSVSADVDMGNSEMKGDISFMWFITIGFVITIITGYAASFLTDRNTIREVDPVLISPPFRKWLIKPLPEWEEEKQKEMEDL